MARRRQEQRPAGEAVQLWERARRHVAEAERTANQAMVAAFPVGTVLEYRHGDTWRRVEVVEAWGSGRVRVRGIDSGVVYVLELHPGATRLVRASGGAS